MSNKNEILKSCPFCGGMPKLYSEKDSHQHGFIHLCEGFSEWMVKIESRYFETEKEAIDTWNRRPTLDTTFDKEEILATIMDIYCKLTTLKILEEAVVCKLKYPDREDIKVWSENVLKSYAELIKKQIDNNTYETNNENIHNLIELIIKFGS